MVLLTVRNYKENPNGQEEFDREVMSKICKICHSGVYMQHPEFPEKYLKCPICGHTKEYVKPDKPS